MSPAFFFKCTTGTSTSNKACRSDRGKLSAANFPLQSMLLIWDTRVIFKSSYLSEIFCFKRDNQYRSNCVESIGFWGKYIHVKICTHWPSSLLMAWICLDGIFTFLFGQPAFIAPLTNMKSKRPPRIKGSKFLYVTCHMYVKAYT